MLFRMLLATLLIATPMLQSADGQALLDAARTGDRAEVERLLEAGIDVNHADRYDSTAIGFAARGGHTEIVLLLLERGADPNQSDSFYNMNPVGRALNEGHVEVAHVLLEAGAVDTGAALGYAIRQDDPELARAAIASGPMSAAARDRWVVQARDAGRDDIVALLETTEVTTVSAGEAATFDPARLPDLEGMYRTGAEDVIIDLFVRDGKLVARTDDLELALEPTGALSFRGADDAGLTVSFFGRGGAIEFMQWTEAGLDLGLRPVDPEEAALIRGGGPPSTDFVRGNDQSAYDPINWPSFRGPGASGVGDGQGVPTSWDIESGDNVRWKTPLPGIANSSPIVWGDRVFVTTAISGSGDAVVRTGLYGDVAPVDDLSPHEFKVYALDRSTGEIVWEHTTYSGPPLVKRHPKSSQANSTPATDGEHLVVLFGTVGKMVCYDLDGNVLWDKDVGVLDSGWFYDPDFQWGHSASPIIYDDLVILLADIQRDPYIAAFDLATGEEVWRTSREEIPTFATPTVYRGLPRDELIANGTRIRSYDPRTGEELWSLAPNSEVIVGTPITGDDLVYVMAGYPPVRPIYAIRPGGSGDISLPENSDSNENIVWSKNRGGTYIPTPILYHGYLYTNANNGRLTAYDAASGAMIYRARIGGTGGSYVASPVASDGSLYFSGEDGTIHVVAAGPEYELIATNEMNEVIWATPALSPGLLIVRTLGHVYGIGQ